MVFGEATEGCSIDKQLLKGHESVKSDLMLQYCSRLLNRIRLPHEEIL